ncbi:NagC family transcriptional regulator [Desulfurococcaceae archaeon MEX13E-LK6-19]|nr:NagC family transcriptional regulator [Desulfurococcaceae archaeon MEX13E-LK6-19]
MIPGLSPRDLKKMLKRMGINVVEIDNVEKVIIVTRDKEITIIEPQVMLFDAGKQKIYQIVAEEVEEEKRALGEEKEEIEISEEDVLFVAEQAGVSPDEAREALIKAKGDLAEAILLLKEEKKN